MTNIFLEKFKNIEQIEAKTEDNIIKKTFKGSLDVFIEQIKPSNDFDYDRINELIESIKIDEKIKVYKHEEKEEKNIFVIFENNEEFKSKFNSLIFGNIPEIVNEGTVKNHIEPISKKEIKKLFEKERAMCAIEYTDKISGKRGDGTGFFCEVSKDIFPSKRALFTNNHIINDSNIDTIEIEYYLKNFMKKKKTLKLNIKTKKRQYYTSEKWDYTCFEVFEDEVDKIFCIDGDILSKNKDKVFPKEAEIFILQLPSLDNIFFSGGKIINILDKKLYYSASTKEGSSGSAIVRRITTRNDNEEYKVIGLHSHTINDKCDKRYSKCNVGISFDLIISHIKLKKELAKQNDDINYLLIGMNDIEMKEIFNIFVFGENYKNNNDSEQKNKCYKYITIKDKSIKINLWIKEQKYKKISPNYIKNYFGLIYTFDIANRDSFNYIINTINTLKDLERKSIIILIGNKINEKPRLVSSKEAQEFANEKNIEFVEINSYKGHNIEEINKLLKSSLENILN